MLVSSFGYLNKNTGAVNVIRTEGSKQQKPLVNQDLAFDMAVNDKQSAGKTQKTEGFIAKCLNIIA